MKYVLSAKEQFERDQEAREYAGPDRVVSSPEIKADLDKVAEATFKIKTGLPSLDRILDGVEAGEMIVVSGPTSGGKTTLLMTITQNMALLGVPSLWFTMEVTPRQFISKISQRGEMPTFFLPLAGYENAPDDFLADFKKKTGRNYEMLDWLEFKINEACVKYNTRVIFIDHLHELFHLSRTGQSRNMSMEIGDLVSRIKHIAVSNNLVIFLIAHNKDNEQGVNKEPYMESVRDSGLITRFADTVIGVWRVNNGDEIEDTRIHPINEGDNKTKVRVWKNRRIGTRGAFFVWHSNHFLSEDAFHGT